MPAEKCKRENAHASPLSKISRQTWSDVAAHAMVSYLEVSSAGKTIPGNTRRVKSILRFGVVSWIVFVPGERNTNQILDTSLDSRNLILASCLR